MGSPVEIHPISSLVVLPDWTCVAGSLADNIIRFVEWDQNKISSKGVSPCIYVETMYGHADKVGALAVFYDVLL